MHCNVVSFLVQYVQVFVLGAETIHDREFERKSYMLSSVHAQAELQVPTGDWQCQQCGNCLRNGMDFSQVRSHCENIFAMYVAINGQAQ